MAADMEGWRGIFGNEIIKQWIVHERDIFVGNNTHILGYGKLGYEKAIRPKWAGQNTVFPIFFLYLSNFSVLKVGKVKGRRLGKVWGVGLVL